MTIVRTSRAAYTVESVAGGILHCRAASGRKRSLTRKEVGTSRYYGAVAHFTRRRPEGK